jgi:predicted Ser/Thr protein kinase
MTMQYEAFCVADPLFYDSPGAAGSGERFAAAARELPAGWSRQINDEWVMQVPGDAQLPRQGWKIHLSACLGNAERIIDLAWTYCTDRGLAFKFLDSRRTVLARNSKYAGRGGSGKVVTIYPADETELELVCKELDSELGDEPGPAILSDLRWGTGPVHVRYGAFSPRYLADERGEIVPAIEDASGTLVPDRRGPVFQVPGWVELPDCLRPHLAARQAVTVADLPYTVDEAIHFSNGGGVYRGTDKRTGDRIILKEARPHAGISADGADAVSRLRHERDVLQQLAGIPEVPRLLDHFTVGEHEFIAMELIEGEGLNTVLARRYPLAGGGADEAALDDHVRWVLDLHARIERAVAAVHERGVVYNDLHLRNVIVRPDGRIALIDFEVADERGAERTRRLGAAGYAAPADWTGVDVDRYALACLKIGLFLPLEGLMGLSRAKAAHLAAIITDLFPVPAGWLDDAVALITGRRPAPAPWSVEPELRCWPAVRDQLAGAVLARATPGRDDRLFAGDVAQFAPGGGHNLANGAAGVLYTLVATGAGRQPHLEEWLIERTRRPAEGTRLGLYDGLHGIAHVLAGLGHHDEAAHLVDIALAEQWQHLGDDLFGGVAGIGLACTHMAGTTGEPRLHEAADAATAIVADRLGARDEQAGSGRTGLLHGGAGAALLFLHRYESTGDAAFLDLAARALRLDLRHCIRRPNGALHVDEGWRSLPYLGRGSVGIGLVLHRFLAHRADEDLAEAAHAIRLAARSPLYVQPGLFNGRAGIILYLSAGRAPGTAVSPDLSDQVRRLGWHAVTHDGHVFFPGDGLRRLSLDLATGNAGVLLALGAALGDRPVHLPFLGPAGRPETDTGERRGGR